MKIYFYRLSDFDTFKEAQQAKSLRWLYIEDSANPSLKHGAARDIVDAICEAVDLCAGAEPLQFVLTDDKDKIIDIF